MRAFLAFATAFISLSLFAQGSLAQYKEGEHYTELTVPLNASSKKIQVEEFFAYSCPHCRTFEAQVSGWKSTLAKDVKFMPTPVAWQLKEEGERGHEMVVMAKAYYLGKFLKVLNTIHPAMFQAVITERKSFKNAADLWPIFEAAGVDKAKFDKLYKNYGIDSKVRIGHSRQLGAQITATPEIIVDGRYSVKPESGLDVLRVVDFLINKIRLERAALAQG